jgi:LCP family protein required for cell wall assembly
MTLAGVAGACLLGGAAVRALLRPGDDAARDADEATPEAAAPGWSVRPLACGLLSLVIPGTGQIYAGRARRGGVILGAFGVAAVVAFALAPDRRDLAATVVRPHVLTGLLVADLCILGLRLWVVADAYRLASARRAPSGARLARPARAAALAFLALATIVPHAAAGWAVLTTSTTLDTVFASREPKDVLDVGGSFSLEDPSPTPRADTAARPDPRHATASPRTARPTTTSPFAALGTRIEKGRWLNLLLIGGDAGYQRYGLRADTLIVVSIQAGTGRSVAFSIPRNLQYAPLTGSAAREYGRFPDLINALYGFGRAHRELYPGGRDPGATALKQTISNLLGIPIQYYALVDLRGFVEVVDAFGGVRVTPTERLVDRVSSAFPGEPWTRLDLVPGRTVHLDGRNALAYVRSRRQSSDYRRMIRQRCFLSTMADQLDPIRAVRHLAELSHAAKRFVSTDIPLSRLPDLIDLVASTNPRSSLGISFTPPAYDTYRPDVGPYRQTVRHVLLTPVQRLRTHDGLRTLAGSCRDGD